MALMLGPMFYLGAKIDNFKDSIHSEMSEFKNEIQLEIKDFHGRLCEIQERNKSK